MNLWQRSGWDTIAFLTRGPRLGMDAEPFVLMVNRSLYLYVFVLVHPYDFHFTALRVLYDCV